MADEETGAPKQLSIAEALKEGVKGATQSGNLSFEELDGASRAAVVLLAVGAESAANVLRQMTPFEVQRLSGKMAVVRSLSRDLVLQVLRQFTQLLAGLAQSQVSSAFGNAGAVGFNGQQGGGCQSGQIAFEQVVVGAVAHGLHGDVLTDFARHQDEGNQLA